MKYATVFTNCSSRKYGTNYTTALAKRGMSALNIYFNTVDSSTKLLRFCTKDSLSCQQTDVKIPLSCLRVVSIFSSNSARKQMKVIPKMLNLQHFVKMAGMSEYQLTAHIHSDLRFSLSLHI